MTNDTRFELRLPASTIEAIDFQRPSHQSRAEFIREAIQERLGTSTPVHVLRAPQAKPAESLKTYERGFTPAPKELKKR